MTIIASYTTPWDSIKENSDRRSVMTYLQRFAVVWQRFITENFDSPAHATHVFQVDASTADNWWRGMVGARGGGMLLVDAAPPAALADRHGLIRIAPPESAIWEAPHLYITLAGTGRGTVLIRALGTVVVPEDPEHPMCDRRRLG